MRKQSPQEDTLADHLEHLAMTADDVASFMQRAHEEGEIHPEALPKAEKLPLSIREVIHAILHHPHLEHLAMDREDVWKQLTLKHSDHDDGTIT